MDWYFFSNPRTHKVTRIDRPKLHPAYKGMHRKYNHDGCVTSEWPMVVLDGVLQYGRLGHGEFSDDVVCNRGCETAVGPDCSCQCGGKNHGIAWKTEEEEKVNV